MSAVSTEPRLPAAVQRMVEEADRLQAEMFPAQAGDDDATTPPEEPAAAEAAAAPPSAPPAPPAPDWEQRYRVLQGKYDAEMPRALAELRNANARIAALEAELAKAAPVQSIEPTAAELEEFGPELLALIDRRAQQAYAPRIAELESEIQTLRGGLDNIQPVVRQSAEERFFSGLTQRVPDWESLNTNSDFLRWLDIEDPLSGQRRAQLLLDAFHSGDIARTANFFTLYKDEHAPPTPTPTPNAGIPANPLAEMVAPGRTVAPLAPNGGARETAKRIWTQADIAAFYRDLTRGRFAKNPQEGEALEADIIAAGLEGRIR